MESDATPMTLAGDDPVAVELLLAIRGGDIAAVERLLERYACWQVARLLVARGARIEELWQAAALGDRGRLEELLSANPAPAQEEISPAFWHACRAGHVRIAATLLDRGADIEFSPEFAGGQTPIQAVEGADTRHQAMVAWLRDHGAAEPPNS